MIDSIDGCKGNKIKLSGLLGQAFDLHGEGVVAVPKNVLGVCGCCDGAVA